VRYVVLWGASIVVNYAYGRKTVSGDNCPEFERTGAVSNRGFQADISEGWLILMAVFAVPPLENFRPGLEHLCGEMPVFSWLVSPVFSIHGGRTFDRLSGSTRRAHSLLFKIAPKHMADNRRIIYLVKPYQLFPFAPGARI